VRSHCDRSLNFTEDDERKLRWLDQSILEIEGTIDGLTSDETKRIADQNNIPKVLPPDIRDQINNTVNQLARDIARSEDLVDSIDFNTKYNTMMAARNALEGILTCVDTPPHTLENLQAYLNKFPHNGLAMQVPTVRELFDELRRLHKFTIPETTAPAESPSAPTPEVVASLGHTWANVSDTKRRQNYLRYLATCNRELENCQATKKQLLLKKARTVRKNEIGCDEHGICYYFHLPHRRAILKYREDLKKEIHDLERSRMPGLVKNKLELKKLKLRAVEDIQQAHDVTALLVMIQNLDDRVKDGRFKSLLANIFLGSVNDLPELVKLHDLSTFNESLETDRNIRKTQPRFFTESEIECIVLLRDTLQIELNCLNNKGLSRVHAQFSAYSIMTKLFNPSDPQLREIMFPGIAPTANLNDSQTMLTILQTYDVQTEERPLKFNKIKFLNRLLTVGTLRELHDLAAQTEAVRLAFPDALKGRKSRVLTILNQVTLSRLYFSACFRAELRAEIDAIEQKIIACNNNNDPIGVARGNLHVKLLQELNAVTCQDEHRLFLTNYADSADPQTKSACNDGRSPVKKMLDKVAVLLEAPSNVAAIQIAPVEEDTSTLRASSTFPG
jgi:hypothetical protein